MTRRNRADVVAGKGALEAVSARGGKGGCIAVDANGNLATPFTTAAMFHGWKHTSGPARTMVIPGD
jgi:beta-aspartyl-peptidase (threonine type)